MSYNFINEAAQIRTSPLCYYDTINGYASDFNTNGNVDGWNYWNGIHTYGCWDGFLFATLYGSYALIGRTTIFSPVPAEDYYFVKVVMKINPTERFGSQVLPTKARFMWVTTSDSAWNTTKSYDFDIEADNEWRAYILNMGGLQYWQGDVNNLRLYPIYQDGRAGDEFFIKSIKISSINTYRCDNVNCDYYTSYSHPCPGIGTKGYCKSSANTSNYYTVEEDVSDDFILNINGYGNETIKVDSINNATGPEIAKALTTVISRIGIGGYSEVEIDYTENKEFIIYSGTYTTDSNVVVVDSSVAQTLGFFDSSGNDLSSKGNGTNPASAAESASSFKIKSFQILSLFDNDDTTSFTFDPFMYNVEGGRRDWLAGGFGTSDISLGTGEYTSAANTSTRDYNLIDNANKTVIDFNHPFNTSGRIKKIYAACTLDQGYTSVSNNPPATSYEGRDEATGCKIKILRPRRNGNLEVVNSIDIPNRDYSGGKLYSYYQESIEIDCNIWVNKGDLIGIYNANVYVGKSISGDQIDALYYQVSGEVSGEFDPGGLNGDGISGLLVYARSNKVQDKLVLDVDLGNRVNVEDIDIIGDVENIFLEYNIARCLDVSWSIDLFGGKHQTGYVNDRLGPEYGLTYTYEHLNLAYGIDKLSDGILTVKDGYAGSGYVVGDESVGGASSPDLTSTFVVTDPQYFFVNGDQEWLGIYQHKRSSYAHSPFVQGFREDPIAFTLLFPHGLNKDIYKSVIYFKEKWNFRNFALSVTYNLDDVLGDADDGRFHYIEEYSAVAIDNQRIEKGGYGYDSVKDYLFANPCNGEPIFKFSGERDADGGYIGIIENYEENRQAGSLDWTYLSHEFGPITCKGFRFYCSYHYSTKINEMELYCRTEDLGSNLVGGMSVSYSYYDDLWWQASLAQESSTKVVADINDTPRYFIVEIEPITKMILSEIIFNVRDDELYIGEKGCEYQVLPVSSKINVTNESKIVEVKNIYNSDYNLYVDIVQDGESDNRLIYHSKMNTVASITDPEIGPDGVYHKSDDYPLVGHYKNCAINNACWGLRNLIDGKKAYYSYDGGYSWSDFGTLSSGVNIDFSNIANVDTSTMVLPVISRNRYWKIAWLAEDHPAMNIREMIPFYDGVEIECDFYHEKTLPLENGPISDTAPHLRNDSVTGSYYKLQGGTSIGMDLGSQESIDKLIWFNDSVSDYDLTYCGIDKYTKLNLTVKDSGIIDYSYDEHNVITSGYFDVRPSSSGISFDGSGEITIPASDVFIFPNTHYTIDFLIEFGDPPVISGADYSVLIRNWDENAVSTIKGVLPFPPPIYESGINYKMENISQPPLPCNFLLIVRSIYNTARIPGAVYSASAIYGGAYASADKAFDGLVDRYNYTAIAGTSGWLKVTLPTAKKIIRYGIISHDTAPIRNIRNFDLEAYITASGTWLTLHSVTDFSTTTAITYYDFSNPYGACEEYRINIHSNYGAGDYCTVNELLLFDENTKNEVYPPSTYQLESWHQYYYPYSGSGRFWGKSCDIISPNTSYHIQFSRYQTASSTQPKLYIDGTEVDTVISYSNNDFPAFGASQDLKIGENFNGVIYDLRISKGVERTNQYTPRERFYTMSIYVSEDNIAYGKYCDVDLYQENSYSYYFSDNVFSSDYYSQLAIDLENRYDLELIRSYGASDTQPFSIYGENSTDIYYSNDETNDVSQVIWATRDVYDNTITLWAGEVSGYDIYPNTTTASKSFTAVDCTGLTKENGFLMIDISCTYYPNNLDTTKNGQIELTSTGGPNVEEWNYILTNAELEVLTDGTYHTFYLPLKHFNTTGGELDVSAINYIRAYYYCKSGTTYGVYLYWKNAKVVWSVPDAINIVNDVKWLRFDLLSGDGTSRVIRKLGIYPDISTQLSPAGGHYNHEWDYFGKSVTAYGSSSNLALGATVSGSSYFGIMFYDNLTNGVINSGEDTAISEENASIYEVWGSDNESSPWITIDLGNSYNIYRFKIYHGYDGVDTNYMAVDYSIQTSIDNQTFTTHFSITDNSSFERTHDLTEPVQARYVRIVITDYDTKRLLLRTDYEEGVLDFFDGAVLREVEIYEYYGYPIISSEEYPIIAINLNDQFYLSSHSIVGVDIEDSSSDWNNENYNFCYSDSVLDNPSKVDFREWKNDPAYDRWAVVRMDTATNYRSGPHYLKHVRITSAEDQNPCVYPWWWQSSISILSRDYTYELVNSTSALKIKYPISTTIDDVSFIEGDHFDIDTLASWRDGFNFRFRIDNINNLDRSYGYFYLGGYDASSGENSIIYKWYISTLSGSLTTGWNNMFLRFKQADEIEYIESNEDIEDVRIIRTINLAKIGLRYKGIGNELTMHLDGFKIERNRFYDYSAHDVGCYLNNNDFITAPIGEYDMSKGTIEFWLRPDYNYNATDYYGIMRNRAIFSFNNNANDVFGFMISYNGLQVYFGNTGQTLNVFSLSDLGLSILDTMFHVGMVFSHDGNHIDSDGSTFRLYFNGLLVFKAFDTWEIIDNKHFTFILGGSSPLSLKAGTYIETSSIDAVISDFKIYNYCKTDFYNSMRNIEDKADNIIKPSNFIELSKDNLTYYKVGAVELPFVYNNVPTGDSIPVYVRTTIPEGLTGKEERTAGLLVYFDISV